ncbi:MAG: hypothetical protein ABIE36_02000 [Candidatus Diapherotrites archaeon]
MNKIRSLEKERDDKEKQDIKQKDKSFLEVTLIKADSTFANYRRGYRTFSVRNPEHSPSIDDNLLSKIANGIRNNYGCRLISLSMSEGDSDFSRKTYIFTFDK